MLQGYIARITINPSVSLPILLRGLKLTCTPLNLRQYVGLDEQVKTESVSVKADEQASEESLQLRIQELEQTLQQCQRELNDLKAQVQNQE